jgi:ATP-binding cassette, subfamily B, bacterial MsbA
MKSIIKIIKLARNYKKQIAFSVFFNIVSSFFSLFSFVLIAPLLDIIFNKDEKFHAEVLEKGKPVFNVSKDYFIDAVNYYLAEIIATSGQLHALLTVCVIIGIAVLSRNVFVYISALFVSIVVNKSVAELRNKIYNTLMFLPLAYLSDEKKGEIISKTTNDVQEIEFSMLSSIYGVFREPVQILIFFVSLFFMSWELSIFIIIFLPFTGLMITLISKSLKKNTKSSQQRFGSLVALLEESLNGFKVIKAFSNEKQFIDKFENINKDFVSDKIKTYRKADLASPTSEFLGVVAIICVLWYGGNLVFSGAMESSYFIAYIAVFSQLINPLKSLSKSIYDAQKGISALERIDEIFEADKKKIVSIKNLPKSTFDSEIKIENLSFSYKDTKVLDNVSFTVERGKTIAIVGQSGSGKSTIANLLPRFYDIQEGSISIDGVNIKDISVSHLRGLIGVVTQESILFNDSVTNNIVFGSGEADLSKVENAAKVANAHEFIVKLEKTYETNVGDGGNKLSGGQKQRISIARAVYKNPPILILDEATSALDTESEKLVQDALEKLMQNRTSIVIAHRLSTIQYADEIIVLHEGKIVERGNHNTLITSNGVYKKLVDMQSFG